MERHLTTPIAEHQARELRVGDVVYLTGTVFTARDEAHARLLEHGAPFELAGLALFHCGPVVQRQDASWLVLAAGPTTSARLELWEGEVLRRFRPRLIVGKGGMGNTTLEALAEVGAAYAHFTGGAGALAAQAIERVADVRWLDDLGMAEAIWVFEVRSFGPLVVAMDSHRQSLYAEVTRQVNDNMAVIHERIRATA